MVGTVIPMNELNNPGPNTKTKFNNLLEDAEERVKRLEQELAPTKEKLAVIGKPEAYEEFELAKLMGIESDLSKLTNVKFKKFIKTNLNLTDMKNICEEIDMLLRQAGNDYYQLSVAYGNRAIEIAKEQVIKKLLELNTKTVLELSDYILLTKRGDTALSDIGMQLNKIAKWRLEIGD